MRKKVVCKKVCDHCGVTYTEYDDGGHKFTHATFDKRYLDCRAIGRHEWSDVKAA